MPRFFHPKVTPDWEAFLACIERKGTPRRVHHIELFHDVEVQQAIGERFDLFDDLDADDPFIGEQRYVRVLSFLGYDYVPQGIDPFPLPIHRLDTRDTADLERKEGRSYVDESKGPVTSWEEFEKYPWPNPAEFTTRALEWYEKNLPENMCIVGRCEAHFMEYLMWLLGYETMCYALYDDRELATEQPVGSDRNPGLIHRGGASPQSRHAARQRPLPPDIRLPQHLPVLAGACVPSESPRRGSSPDHPRLV